MTCDELLTIARREKPHVRYAKTREGTAVGGWNNELARFQPVAALGIDGRWYSVEHELLIDGKPVWSDWIE